MFHRDLAHTGYSNSTAPSTNQLGWNYTTGGAVESSPAVLGDVVFVGSDDGKVYALGASNRTLLWSYTTGGNVSSSPAVAGGAVFVGSTGSPYGRVYALNASTGSLLWNYTTIGGQVYSSPVAVGGMVFVSSGIRVYALNASTGTLIWSSATSSFIWSSPAVAGGRVFVGSTDNRVYALNASTGTSIWSYSTSGAVYSSPAVAGGIVYVGSYDKNVTALDASTGSFLWNYTTSGSVHSSPAVANDVVFVGSNDWSVYALDASTGSYLWSYPTGGPVYSSPAAVGGMIFFGSYDGKVYALSSTGTLVWSYTTGGQIDSSPAVADGTLFIGSGDHNIYAFGQLPLSVTVSPVSVVMDANQYKIFTSTVTGGTSPYTYQWYRNGILNGTSSSYIFSTFTPGSYTVYVNVTDSTSLTVKSNVANMTVNPIPTASISPTSVVMDVGQSRSFTSSVTGGTPPYSYLWLLNNSATSGTTPNWTFTAASPAIYNIRVRVIDSAGYTISSNTAVVTANTPPSVSITPNSTTIDIGQSKQFTSIISNGTLPFDYQWYLNNAPVTGATNPSWTFTPASAGSYNVYLNVTDDVGVKAKSNVATVTVNTAPSVSVSPTSAVMDVGQSKIFTSTPTGGTTPFTYQWYLNTTAVTGTNSSTWSFAPNSSGLYNIHVNVTDSAGFTAKSNIAAVTVNPALTVAISPLSVVLDVGQSQLFSSSVSGGTPSYSYQWYLNGTLVTGATSSSWAFTPASAGVNSVSMKVTDTAGAAVISNTATATDNTHGHHFTCGDRHGLWPVSNLHFQCYRRHLATSLSVVFERHGSFWRDRFQLGLHSQLHRTVHCLPKRDRQRRSPSKIEHGEHHSQPSPLRHYFSWLDCS
jgi:outer membrane protein assembly factor BamB